MLYKTTKDFLMRFGLRDLTELPSLEEFEKLAAGEMQDELFAAGEGAVADATGTPSDDGGMEQMEEDKAERSGECDRTYSIFRPRARQSRRTGGRTRLPLKDRRLRMPPQRLQKIIAAAGISSRRKAEELITQGRVSVNGQTVTELGNKADIERDHIKVDGKLLQGAERHVYLLLNKPKGYVTTVTDPERRPT